MTCPPADFSAATDWRLGLPVLRNDRVLLREPVLTDAPVIFRELCGTRSVCIRAAAAHGGRRRQADDQQEHRALRFAFRQVGLEAVDAWVVAENRRANRALEKLGGVAVYSPHTQSPDGRTADFIVWTLRDAGRSGA